jgi:hypothetical protein
MMILLQIAASCAEEKVAGCVTASSATDIYNPKHFENSPVKILTPGNALKKL